MSWASLAWEPETLDYHPRQELVQVQDQYIRYVPRPHASGWARPSAVCAADNKVVRLWPLPLSSVHVGVEGLRYCHCSDIGTNLGTSLSLLRICCRHKFLPVRLPKSPSIRGTGNRREKASTLVRKHLSSSSQEHGSHRVPLQIHRP